MPFQRSNDRSKRRKTAKRRGILRVTYRIDIKKQARGADDRRKVKTHKQHSGEKCISGMDLLVDQAKPGGCGTIDDDNRARRFSKDPSLSACISGLSEMLMRRCAVTLQILWSGNTVNIVACDQHAKETAGLLVAEYPW